MLCKIPLPTTEAGTRQAGSHLGLGPAVPRNRGAQTRPQGSKVHEDRENEATVVGSGVEAVVLFIVLRGEAPEQASSGITRAICLKTTPAPQSSRTREEEVS